MIEVNATVCASVVHINDVGPAIAVEVCGVLHPEIIEERGRAGGLGKRDLPPFRVVRAVVDVGTLDYGRDAVVVEIGIGDAHRVIGIADLLLAKVGRSLF